MNSTSDVHLAVRRADGFLARLKGLMFERSIGPDTGLWINRCNAIHTFFMRFPIDVIFLDRDLKVVKLCPNAPPYRLGPFCRGAASVLEFASGFIARTGITESHALEFDSKSDLALGLAAARFRIS